MSAATRTSIFFPSSDSRRGWPRLWRSPIAATLAAGTLGCSTANPAPLRAVERTLDLEGIIETTDRFREGGFVGVPSRRNAWIRSRSPHANGVELEMRTNKLVGLGYDTEKLGKVPQRWPSTGFHPGEPDEWCVSHYRLCDED